MNELKLDDLKRIDVVVVEGKVEGLSRVYKVTLTSPFVGDLATPTVSHMRCVWDPCVPGSDLGARGLKQYRELREIFHIHLLDVLNARGIGKPGFALICE